jgi:hypothetical protein
MKVIPKGQEFARSRIRNIRIVAAARRRVGELEALVQPEVVVVVIADHHDNLVGCMTHPTGVTVGAVSRGKSGTGLLPHTISVLGATGKAPRRVGEAFRPVEVLLPRGEREGRRAVAAGEL